MKGLAYYFDHPDSLNKQTLFELRSLLAQYPYCQPVRILLLKNLLLLHDATFDEELRRAAIYITDRSVLFDMIEAAHYQLAPDTQVKQNIDNKKQEKPTENRTVALIDDFLEQIPETKEDENKGLREPTPIDATTDYVAYLMEIDQKQTEDVPQLKGQTLIDNFINNEGGRITLQESKEIEELELEEETEDNSYFTETLARIYIKQGRYLKALEIIRRLNLVYPKKNSYFADQIRFLEKLVINNNHK